MNSSILKYGKWGVARSKTRKVGKSVMLRILVFPMDRNCEYLKRAFMIRFTIANWWGWGWIAVKRT